MAWPGAVWSGVAWVVPRKTGRQMRELNATSNYARHKKKSTPIICLPVKVLKLKTCSKCKVEKKLSEFYRKASAKDGYAGTCKDCQKENKKKDKGEKGECYRDN